MKVLLIDVNCKYSSTGKIVYDLYSQLNAGGHKAAIAYGRGALVSEENINRFSPEWEVKLHAFLTRITGYTGCFSYVATKRLIKFIEKFQPDIVHLHDMHGYFVNIIPLIDYLKRKNIKTVWTFHCEFMYTGKCGYAYECERWKDNCGKCPRLKDYPCSVFFDHTSRMHLNKKNVFEGFHNLRIVSPSRWLAERTAQSFLKNREIAVIHNGIDTKIFYKRDTYGLKDKLKLGDEKVVLAVAPDIFSERKGGRHVLQIARNMREYHIKFILIGVADDNLEQKTDDNVIKIGLIKDQNLLAEFYSLADVFLICSERENYPTTCLEAAACGAFVVGYDVGGTAETVDEGRGIFVPYGKMEGIQSGIEHFLYETEKVRIDETNADHYSKERMYREYVEVYGQEYGET